MLDRLADFGTFVAALATIGLVFLALVQLRSLRQQVTQGQDAVAAAKTSAEAAEAAVLESARVRTDEQAPRVIAVMETPEWPPFIDRTRSHMPGGGEPSLLDTLGQSALAGSQPFVFDTERDWLMWLRVRGVLINEGRGTARVRLDGPARFVEVESALAGVQDLVPMPPTVGTPDRREHLLRPGQAAVFEWGAGHPLGKWADAHENPRPRNPLGACFMIVTVFDWFEYGVVDYIHLEMTGRPIVPVQGRLGHWVTPESLDGHVDITVYPTLRMYRAEGEQPPEPPWLETYSEWNEQQRGE